MTIVAVVPVDDMFDIGLKSRYHRFREVEPPVTFHERRGNLKVSRLPLLTRPEEGHSDDIPENVYRRVSEKV